MAGQGQDEREGGKKEGGKRERNEEEDGEKSRRKWIEDKRRR